MVSHNQTPNKGVPIFVNGHTVGIVSGATFYKSITGSKHILRVPRAIGFDRCTLDAAERAGAVNVHITDNETGTTYTATIADVRHYGVAVARGFGPQVALPIDRYSVNGATPVAEQRAADTNQERKDLQMGLFGGAA